MSIDLKKILKERVEMVAPEYGLHEVLYTSFTRSYGYRGLMSASDVVYSVTSLLETSPASLVAMKYSPEWMTEEMRTKAALADVSSSVQGGEDERASWWHANFFRACDSLDGSGGEGDQLRQGLKLCMQVQKAVIRQGIAIIEKQVIITLSKCRVATLKDGPDLPVFWDPLSLHKLAQFLVYAIRVSEGCRPIYVQVREHFMTHIHVVKGRGDAIEANVVIYFTPSLALFDRNTEAARVDIGRSPLSLRF